MCSSHVGQQPFADLLGERTATSTVRLLLVVVIQESHSSIEFTLIFCVDVEPSSRPLGGSAGAAGGSGSRDADVCLASVWPCVRWKVTRDSTGARASAQSQQILHRTAI